jgi:hypothetical protein
MRGTAQARSLVKGKTVVMTGGMAKSQRRPLCHRWSSRKSILPDEGRLQGLNIFEDETRASRSFDKFADKMLKIRRIGTFVTY